MTSGKPLTLSEPQGPSSEVGKRVTQLLGLLGDGIRSSMKGLRCALINSTLCKKSNCLRCWCLAASVSWEQSILRKFGHSGPFGPVTQQTQVAEESLSLLVAPEMPMLQPPSKGTR